MNNKKLAELCNEYAKLTETLANLSFNDVEVVTFYRQKNSIDIYDVKPFVDLLKEFYLEKQENCFVEILKLIKEIG